jgi:hypothetical protein
MLALRDLQIAVGRSVLGRDAPALEAAIADDRIEPTARLRIYRHHFETSLTEALMAIYPVVCRLVDERYFAYAAHEYIAAHPPRLACLHEYGESFPGFLASFSPCRALSYLPDVARLERQTNASFNASIATPLDPGAFAALAVEDYPHLVFRLLPSAGYLNSPWPVDRIWLGQEEVVDLAEDGCRLEVCQRGEEVVFARLDAPQFALRRALSAGEPLARAAGAALDADPRFDLTMALRLLLAEELVTGFDLACDQPATLPQE